MELYLSGATQSGENQSIVSKSLGGFMSSIKVNNNVLNNLFDSLNYGDINKTVFRVVFLKNTLENTVNNINIYYTNNDKVSVRIGIVQPNSSGAIERINSEQSTPLYATFISAQDEVNKVNIGNLVSGGTLGIWFERKVTKAIQPLDKDLYDNYSAYKLILTKIENEETITSDEELFYENYLNEIDKVDLVIEWD